jgi:ABC-type polysaccharide/polyol phosphate transport system ATPase subunit
MSQDASSGRRPIVVEAVGKTFRVPEERMHTLKERALHPMRRSRYNTFPSLRGVSFDVRKGEFFGIAGRNGSGKSTLLKCLAGIYKVDEGRIWMNGRVSTFIELGVGFNPDLAARDNVVLNGIMMGLSPREARARYDAVMDFAELRDFEELKLKNYSSGMHVRLAFSVAIQVDAEILLIDEVLAVGDAAFQQKCFDVFISMRDEGRTIVFVTHDMGSLSRFCHRALLLEKGEMVRLGEPHEVADRYFEINFGADESDRPHASGRAEVPKQAQITEVWIEDDHGNRLTTLPQGRRMTVRMRVSFVEYVDDPVASLEILNEDHVPIVGTNGLEAGERRGFNAGDEAVFSFSFVNVLAPRRYTPVLTLARNGTGHDLIDRVDDGLSFIVTSPATSGAVVDLPIEIDVSAEFRNSAGVRT